MPTPARRHAAVQDGLVALAVLGAWTLAVALLVGSGYWHPRSPGSYLWTGLWLAVPIALHRSGPGVALALTLTAYPLGYLVTTDGVPLLAEIHAAPYVLAAYVATRGGAVRPVPAGAAAAASLAVLLLGTHRLLHPAGGLWPPPDPSRSVLLLLLVAAATALGAVVARLSATARSLEERNAELRALQEVRTRAAVQAERTRIARELHDVVAHHVTAIVVRAQAADRVGGERPEEYRDAVRWIAPAGKEALTSMRSVVRVLRDGEPAGGGDGAPRAPLPGLADLSAVLDRVRDAGLAVDADLPPVLPACPPAAGLAVVRVAQEALTNVSVHSDAARARVALAAAPGVLTLRVEDPGPARAGTRGPDGGHGLLHMRERAAACGGHVTAGPAPGGGWAVTLEVPVP
ncbi:sensor histidine kinase [Cellulomonas telluris]|uniref:sensor histidine kinase n=1 Tax=Cellulomonas telluris TaxID=2306636 RepID=UPI0010A79E38|nr:histidine kinase [Cellulomonas telluris]